MSQEIESYLVKLGFSVDAQGLQKFNATLQDVGKKMSTTVTGLTGDFFKLQFQLTSGMLAIGAASVAAMTSFADFDKAMRLGAMGALMSKGAYTELNEALRMTGVTLAQASWDPESHARVLENMELIHKLNLALGPDAEANAKKIRDFKNEFEQLGEELKYLSFAIGSDLFSKLFGGGEAQAALQRFNEWLLNNLPKLADEISTDLVPIMRDLWETTKDVGLVFKDLFAIFQDLTGVLSGDTSLQTTDVTLKSVADTTKHAVEWVDGLVKSILHLEEALLKLDFSKLTTKDAEGLGEIGLLIGGRQLLRGGGKGVGSLLGFDVQKVFVTNLPGGGLFGAGAASEGAGMGLGAAIPIVGTATAGALALNHATQGTFWGGFDLSSWSAFKTQLMGTDPKAGTGTDSNPGSVHDRLKQNADAIAALTGQPASLIYDQLAHESGNGTNRGFRDLHNLSGIRDNKGHYRNYASDADYDVDMARILRRDLGTLAATNIRDYSTRLKRGGYYEDSQVNYERGMRSFDGQYGAPTVNNHVTVNVAKSSATPQEIASVVTEKLAEQSQRNARFASAQSTGVNQ